MSYSYTPHDPYTPHNAGPDLNHKVSDLSESPYDPDTGGPSALRGRESLVSLQSSYEPTQNSAGTRSNRTSWHIPFTSPKPGYASVSMADGMAVPPRHFKSFRTRKNEQYQTIQEDESIDLANLKAEASPVHAGSYSAVPNSDDAMPAFDVTAFSSPMPMTYQNPVPPTALQQQQQQEYGRMLTGGLGVPPSPTTVMRQEELAEFGSSGFLGFSRSWSRNKGSYGGSSAQVRDRGQETANKTGEVIEVIMEESDVDLSTMTGPSSYGFDEGMQKSSLPAPERYQKKQTFYPQPNWKPVFMRWPYLGGLIMLSTILGIGQEVLFQSSVENGLVEFHRSTEIGGFKYFAIRFLPTIIAVSFGVLWQNTDLEVKRFEAFYQMSKEGGALAAESINVDYVTVFSFARPLRALHRKHYAAAVSSVASLLAFALVPTLSAAVIILTPGREMRLNDMDVLKQVTVDPVLSRILTATFFIIAILGGVLLYQLQTRRTGLLRDVKGIAGLAAMAVVSHVMNDFRDMDVAKPQAIHRKLKNRRYLLRNCSLEPDDAAIVTTQESDRYKNAHLSDNPHPIMLRKEGAIPFLIFILFFIMFIPVIIFTDARVISDKTPWVITALAVCIKLCWGGLETSIKMMEPYYILSNRHAPPKTLTLDYTSVPFFAVAVRAVINRHWLVFLTSAGTVKAEVLTILVTSLATVDGKDFMHQIHQSDDLSDTGLSGSETVLSFLVALGVTLYILFYMFATTLVVFIRRRHSFLPRQPNTIASVLGFMHQSKMLYDFVGTSKFTNEEMDDWLERIGKTYGLGWFRGRDGQTHCGVDEEELNGNYKHGIDYSKSNQAWLTEWQNF